MEIDLLITLLDIMAEYLTPKNILNIIELNEEMYEIHITNLRITSSVIKICFNQIK